MTAKTSPARRAAFLRALAATGNRTIAAERARVSRSWVQLHRTNDPVFRAAMDEAVAAAKAKLSAGGGIAPPSGWGSLDGEELVVRGTNGRRVQIARSRLRQFSPRVEARFLSVLAATCNVKAACAEIGMSPAAVYAHRNRRQGFADRWDKAVENGYVRLETGLIETAGCLLSGETIDPDLSMGRMSVAQAMQLLFRHHKSVHKLGKARWGAEPSIETVRAEVLRRVEALERSAVMPEGEMEAARREWAARRVG